MRSRRYRFVLASLLVVLAACAGANGDPAPPVVEAGVDAGTAINCVDAGATE